MKRYKIALMVLSILLFSSMLYAYDYHKFHDITTLIDLNEVENTGFTKIGANGETKVIEASERKTLVTVMGKDYVVDNDKLFVILSQYKCIRSRNDYFPLLSEGVDVELSLIQDQKPRHLVLGEFNIWYRSSDAEVYDIINGNQLREEIIQLVESSNKQAQMEKPPTLKVHSNEKTLEAIRGTYSWTTQNADGTGTTTHVDCAGPNDMVKGSIPFVLPSSSTLLLTFENPPSQVLVYICSSDGNKKVEVNGGRFKVPAIKGLYVYEVVATWQQGTCSYAFLVNVN